MKFSSLIVESYPQIVSKRFPHGLSKDEYDKIEKEVSRKMRDALQELLQFETLSRPYKYRYFKQQTGLEYRKRAIKIPILGDKNKLSTVPARPMSTSFDVSLYTKNVLNHRTPILISTQILCGKEGYIQGESEWPSKILITCFISSIEKIQLLIEEPIELSDYLKRFMNVLEHEVCHCQGFTGIRPSKYYKIKDQLGPESGTIERFKDPYEFQAEVGQLISYYNKLSLEEKNKIKTLSDLVMQAFNISSGYSSYQTRALLSNNTLRKKIVSVLEKEGIFLPEEQRKVSLERKIFNYLNQKPAAGAPVAGFPAGSID